MIDVNKPVTNPESGQKTMNRHWFLPMKI